ncbi:MAG: hypothetical protein KJ706_00510 [Candidatus Omnitrophica bacterium]|nr:hypothetical protein [Candidatus Omnitrophota bacterium]MCG2705336.1 hypothetical protein [Candidatus Omnitrophota bacterium]
MSEDLTLKFLMDLFDTKEEKEIISGIFRNLGDQKILETLIDMKGSKGKKTND